MGNTIICGHSGRLERSIGLCQACYWYKRRHPDWEVGSTKPERWGDKPLLCGHNRRHKANGLCEPCWQFKSYTPDWNPSFGRSEGRGRKNCGIHHVAVRDCGCSAKHQATHNIRYRIRALLMMGGECANCGDTRLSVLQIDHVGGGGNLERREKGNFRIDRAIALGVRDTRDLQLLCANCHHLKSYGSRFWDEVELSVRREFEKNKVV